MKTYSSTFTLRQIELEIIATSYATHETLAVVPTIITEHTTREEDTSTGQTLLDTSTLLGDLDPLSTTGVLHTESAPGVYNYNYSADAATSPDASSSVVQLTALDGRPMVNLSNNSAVDSLLDVRSGSMDIASWSSTSYSVASSRTASTDYGIYARRLAISQDTIESSSLASDLIYPFS